MAVRQSDFYNPLLGNLSSVDHLTWTSLASYVLDPNAYEKDQIVKALEWVLLRIGLLDDAPFKPNLRIDMLDTSLDRSEHYGAILRFATLIQAEHPELGLLGWKVPRCTIKRTGVDRLACSPPAYKYKGQWWHTASMTHDLEKYLVCLALASEYGPRIGEGWRPTIKERDEYLSAKEEVEDDDE